MINNICRRFNGIVLYKLDVRYRVSARPLNHPLNVYVLLQRHGPTIQVLCLYVYEYRTQRSLPRVPTHQGCIYSVTYIIPHHIHMNTRRHPTFTVNVSAYFLVIFPFLFFFLYLTSSRVRSSRHSRVLFFLYRRGCVHHHYVPTLARTRVYTRKDARRSFGVTAAI